jgi:hypothetical protein
MGIFCVHGPGRCVLTDDGFLVFTVDGFVVSSDRRLSQNYRILLERHLAAYPPQQGHLTPRQIQASFEFSYDESDASESDCSLGSTDTWSMEEDRYDD